jgi:hypothetical protein
MAQSILHRISTLHFGAKTCPNLIYLHHTRKKDLTTIAFARILAQGAHRFRTSLSHWRPRAEKFEKSSIISDFFRECFTWNIFGSVPKPRDALPKIGDLQFFALREFLLLSS